LNARFHAARGLLHRRQDGLGEAQGDERVVKTRAGQRGAGGNAAKRRLELGRSEAEDVHHHCQLVDERRGRVGLEPELAQRVVDQPRGLRARDLASPSATSVRVGTNVLIASLTP